MFWFLPIVNQNFKKFALFSWIYFVITELIDFWMFWLYNFPQPEAKPEETPGWTILRDDFMMGASMKDWDKESDGPDDSRPGSASDCDV